jgi:tetratricopeptide (TPR) repeat protein
MEHTDLDFDPELEKLEQLSNGILDLIEEGRFAEAERACEVLRRDFPDQIDWVERTAALHEARGERDAAIEHYEKCITHIRKHADDFDPDCVEWYRGKIEQIRAAGG